MCVCARVALTTTGWPRNRVISPDAVQVTRDSPATIIAGRCAPRAFAIDADTLARVQLT